MNFRVRVLTVLLACSLSAGLAVPAGAAFRDVSDSAWYAADVAAMEEYGILNGVGENCFDPGGTLTLAQAVTIACRVFCFHEGLSLPPMPEGESWYENYLDLAESLGIWKQGEFGRTPDGRCSRLAMATLFARVFPQDTARTLNTVEKLPDVERTEATAGVYFLYEQGVLAGNDETGLFFPARSITRAETAAILHRILDPDCRKQFTLQEKTGGTYEPCEGLLLYENYLTFWPRSIAQVQGVLEDKANALNGTFRRHPELDFYVYYIEKDTDMDFETGVLSGISDTFLDWLELPLAQKAAFKVSTFEDFTSSFYRTDTHWKAQGSYRAYLELTDILNSPGEPLRPNGGLITLTNAYQGSKATDRVDTSFAEPFRVYAFSYPPMRVTVNGRVQSEYGNELAYLSGKMKAPVSYGDFYGWDRGEVVLSTGRGTESILILGESYDNAVVKLLANHYQTVYSVDLRWYEKHMGETFDLTAYTRDRGISKVLLIGNIDYFCSPGFDPE